MERLIAAHSAGQDMTAAHEDYHNFRLGLVASSEAEVTAQTKVCARCPCVALYCGRCGRIRKHCTCDTDGHATGCLVLQGLAALAAKLEVDPAHMRVAFARTLELSRTTTGAHRVQQIASAVAAGAEKRRWRPFRSVHGHPFKLSDPCYRRSRFRRGRPGVLEQGCGQVRCRAAGLARARAQRARCREGRLGLH
eukprot:COSAG01_NODE_4312_length_5142_cov_2.895697_3_plen_194_part_00